MRILLDTVTFLWGVLDGAKLSDRGRSLWIDPANDVYLSSVSAWEITVKHRLGRLPLPEAPAQLVPRLRQAHGVDALPLDEDSVLHLGRLPELHRDPFDRMLVCQAIVNGMTILTPDATIHSYPARTYW